MARNDCFININFTDKEISIADTTWIVIVSSGLVLSIIAVLLCIVTRRYHSCHHRLSLYIVLASCFRTTLMLLREIKDQDPATYATIDSVNMYGAYMFVFLTCWASVYVVSLAFFKQKLNNTKYELIGGIIIVLCPVPFVAATTIIDIAIDDCSHLYWIYQFCLEIPIPLGVLFSVCSQCTVVGVFIATTARAGIHRKYHIKALQELLPLMAQVFCYELGICLNWTSYILVLANRQTTFVSEELNALFPISYVAIALVSICSPSNVKKACSPCCQVQGASSPAPNTHTCDHMYVNDHNSSFPHPLHCQARNNR